MIEPAVAPQREVPGQRWRLVAAATVAVLVLDQLTKTWALRVLDDRIIDVVGSLRLRLVFNTGSAFSIGAGLGPVLALVGVAIVVVLLRASRDLVGTPALVALGLVVGGAVGNLADRAFRGGDGLLHGAVVDFVDLQWWPVFNVADMAICAGVALLALVLGREGAGPAEPAGGATAAPPHEVVPGRGAGGDGGGPDVAQR